MKQSIVCGVDGSEESASALSTAHWLADRIGARLVVIHVASAPADHAGRAYGSYVRAYDAAFERGELILGRALYRPDLPRELERRVEVGDPAERLAAAARDADAALVLVGTRRRGPLRSALLGSVSRALLSACDRPVVMVPKDAVPPIKGQAVRSLVCGVDDSETSARTVAVAAALAARLDLHLVLAHTCAPAESLASIPASSGVSPVDADALEKRARRRGIEVLDRAEKVAGATVPVGRKLLIGDAAAPLADLAAAERAAIVVVGTRGRGAAQASVLGSFSSALVGCAQRPVAVVTAKALIPEAPATRPTASRRFDSSSPAQR